MFPTIDTNSVYQFRVRLYSFTYLENGPRYCPKFPLESQTITLSGELIEYFRNSCQQWMESYRINFLQTATCLMYITDPPGILTGDIYYYDGGYRSLGEGDSIKPGIGYWIKTNNSGD